MKNVVVLSTDKAVYPINAMGISKAMMEKVLVAKSRNAGNTISQWVLTASGDIMPIQTLRRLTSVEKSNPTMMDRISEFDKFIKKRFGDIP